MAKSVSPAKEQEWLGLDRIQRETHAMKCIYREMHKDDFGIDGEIEVVVPKALGEGYEASGGILKFQSKSGKSYIKEDKKDSFAVYVKKHDLEYWYSANFPVLLIVLHPKDDKLYFVEVKDYLRRSPTVFKAPYKIIFDKTQDEYSTRAYNRLLQIAGASQPKVSTTARERLYTNLLPIKRLANLMTSAETRFIDRQDVFDEIRRSFPGKPQSLPPFFIKAGRMYTFADLRDRKCSLRLFCNPESINDEWAQKWAEDPEGQRDLIHLLNLVLGSHTHRLGLAYDRNYKRTYFPREDERGLEFRRKWYNVRSGRQVIPRTVVKYYEYGRDHFWRHSAANLTFKLLGHAWYLQIVPRYFFTQDGKTPCDGSWVGPYSTRIKAQERNLKVLNDVLFWSDILANGSNEIVMTYRNLPLIVIERTPLSEIANFAVLGDPAVYEDEEEPSNFFEIWDRDDVYTGDNDDERSTTIYVNARALGLEDVDVD